MVRLAFTAVAFAAIAAAELTIVGSGAECPLKRTDVRADIAGSLARVTLTQEFQNTAPDRIEAVYSFPMPHAAAVDSMTMRINTRVIRGKVLGRDEARALYEAARDTGRRAALLDQERPNLFTQRITGIGPGETIKITISWNQHVRYEAGTYEWVLPTVVGPRYKSPVPSSYIEKSARAGHDIAIEVSLDAGLPIEWIGSTTHEVTIDRPRATAALVRLRNGSTIPNKDFTLRYDIAGKRLADSVLAHKTGETGYFSLVLQPPESFTTRDLTPRELVFVLDTSGSMSGFPIEKAKEAMSMAIASLNPFDTFNVITFSGDTHILFPQPAPATPHNVQAARHFLAGRRGTGGTEMMKALRAALEPSRSQSHMRIVCFMTDGYVGNEDEILQGIRTYSNARVFAFGIGNSVNRYLLDRMAEEGRGEVEYVSLKDDGSAAARRFHERVRNPLLTDIGVDWGGLDVTDALPHRIPDLFSAKPLIITGRYRKALNGRIRVTGKLAGVPWSRNINLSLPAEEPKHTALPGLWAKARVDSLWGEVDAQSAITKLGIDFGLMTPFTSFVVVEETTVLEGGKPRRVDVPLEMPDGVSHEGVAGVGALTFVQRTGTPSFMPQPPSPPVATQAAAESHARAVMKRHFGLRSATGKVRVEVWLTTSPAAVIARLKALGFVITSESRRTRAVIGEIDAARLSQLEQLPEVRWIAPATR